MAKILITGATGLIGKELGRKLYEEGNQIYIVSRKNSDKAKSEVPFRCEVIQGDLSSGEIEDPRLEEIEIIFHLVGENIGKGFWTAKNKKKFLVSRIETTKNLKASFLKLKKNKLKKYIGASAVGFYGDRVEESLTEISLSGTGFLSELVVAWEKEHLEWSSAFKSIQLTLLRLGVVHSYKGGILSELIPLFKMGLGSPLGHGRQYFSWVDLEDVVGVCYWLLQQQKLSLVYNLVSPHLTTNLEWSQSLASCLKVKMLPSVPSGILKTFLREKASLVLSSQKVRPHNLIEEGYEFKHKDLESSFKKLMGQYANSTHIFYSEQFIDKPIDEVFEFFSQAYNLEKITPPFLNFKIKSVSTDKIEEGTIIKYKLKLHGLPVFWKTQILNWNPPHEFVDNQESGPYKKWHHTHSFIPLKGGGTLMIDTVKYSLPFYPLGDWAGFFYVKKEISKIFAYRRDFCSKFFSSTP